MQHVHMIGRNRGALRLWLEGKRLVDSGFAQGKSYLLDSQPGRMALSCPHNGFASDCTLPKRRISGKAGKPIVDITGRDVAKAFPDGGKVLVTYHTGLIEVVPA